MEKSETVRGRWIKTGVYRESSDVEIEISKEKNKRRRDRRRGEDECKMGDGGTPDSWHRLPGDHVPQTDAPAGPDRHH